jgi:uncharacterized protein (DUF2147 family)
MMKKIFLLGILAVIFTGIVAADPAEGFWISVDDKTGKATAGWQIYIEGGKLSGRILSIADYAQTEKAYKCKESYRGFPIPGKVNEMTVVSTIWLWGLERRQEGQWRSGNVIDPDDGNMYGCQVTFHAADGNRYKADTLEMRGTLGPFGRSQFWKRATQAEAAALR